MSLKNTLFSGFLLLIAIFIYDKSVPPSVEPIVQMTMLQNEKPIGEVNQSRSITQSKTLWIDEINFPNGRQFSHRRLGPMGMDHYFFVDFMVNFEALESGGYFFNISSDDGFRLFIDGELLCEFVKDRPFKTNVCRIENMEKGEHHLKLEYFQGGGGCGLVAKYKHSKDRQYHMIGESTRYLTFHPVEE